MPVDTAPSISSTIEPNRQIRRRNRLMSIVENGLPPFERSVAELTAILGDPSADIRKAAGPIRTDPALTAQVLRMCNSPLFGRHSRVISIEQATVLLGSERIRSLAMNTSFANFSERGLSRDQIGNFWRHSVLAAMLSKHLAEHTGYPESEQAYIAGLLHDVGEVPQWMLMVEEQIKPEDDFEDRWLDNPMIQRRHFGIDRCELGSHMARGWELMPSFVDVILKHHEPLEAEHDPYLVQIVAGVEHFLLAREECLIAPKGPERQTSGTRWSTTRSRQPFDNVDWEHIADNLEREYDRLLPLLPVL